jgi:hypothetical protein
MKMNLNMNDILKMNTLAITILYDLNQNDSVGMIWKDK